MQSKQVGWSALVAAPLIGITLLWSSPLLMALGGTATMATLLLAWWSRAERVVMVAAAAATMLWIIQRWLPPTLQWGNGLVLGGVLLAAATIALVRGEPQQGNRPFRNLVFLSTLLAYLSAQMTFFASHMSAALVTAYRWLLLAELGAVAVLGLMIFLMVRRALVRQHQPLVRRLALLSTLVYTFYLLLVLSPHWSGQSASGTVLLVAGGALWAILVALLMAVLRLPNKPLADQIAEKKGAPAWQVTLNDYLTLMKYRVSSLLLVTTLGGMVVAAQGWPGWALVGWVMLGGLISVGGAGSLNHYLDRDIDINMGRTSLRPIPAGRMEPWKALVFGLVLSVLQFVIFWFKVNPLAAWLSTAGLLYYVIIYTIILKRSSTQNIVVGGAAGAFPPLVGWAAVTGDLSTGALFLFAIIFYWTPPHFWALALMRKEDYARARVPMLPVVRGERDTRIQIVLYSLLMVALTMMMVPLRYMGIIYLVAALLLNAKFLWDAIVLYRKPSNQSALALYKYSLLYLALLFAAMAVDRSLLA